MYFFLFFFAKNTKYKKWCKKNPYLSETESFFCLTGNELGKEGSQLKDSFLPSAEDNKMYTKSHTGNLLFSSLCVRVCVPSRAYGWLSNLCFQV